MADYELEDAIKLSEDCCDKKELLTFATKVYWNCGGGGRTSLVCANCRTAYDWDWDEKKAWKLGIKYSDADLYQRIEWQPRFLKYAKDNYPKHFDYFVKKLKLDKKKLEDILK